MNKTNCKVYRCSSRDEMYLYVEENQALEDLPAELMKRVKQLTHVMDLELSQERKLAREDVNKVIASLEEKGFFLQMPVGPLKAELYYGD